MIFLKIFWKVLCLIEGDQPEPELPPVNMVEGFMKSFSDPEFTIFGPFLGPFRPAMENGIQNIATTGFIKDKSVLVQESEGEKVVGILSEAMNFLAGSVFPVPEMSSELGSVLGPMLNSQDKDKQNRAQAATTVIGSLSKEWDSLVSDVAKSAKIKEVANFICDGIPEAQGKKVFSNYPFVCN